MREAFIEKRFSDENYQLIILMVGILKEYADKGFDLSVRQLYYQLVARGYIPNTVRSYKKVAAILSDARLAGLVDWDMIVDRGRRTEWRTHWSDPAEITRAAANSFIIDKWAAQEWHVESMVEKQALEGVLVRVCDRLDIRFTANKGYSSASTMYTIGKRIARKWREGHKTLVVYLGDHDPSGIDMTRDVRERLEMFSGVTAPELTIERVALNLDQIKRFNPPENPAKETDSRYSMYSARFGESSWELDALNPETLAGLVTDAVMEVRNNILWEEAEAEEGKMREKLLDAAARMEDEDDDL